MQRPKDFDAIDLLYAAQAICGGTPLKEAGLNQRGYRGAKKALNWLVDGIIDAVRERKQKQPRKR